MVCTRDDVLSPDRLAQAIRSRQHLHPHQPLAGALLSIPVDAGAMTAAIRDTGLDAAQCIGRLRSVQVCELAQRLYRQSAGTAPGAWG